MWWLATAGRAAEPVVFVGDEARALERVAAATRVERAQLEPVAARALRELPVSVGSGGEVFPCDGPLVTREQLQLAVESAESALGLGDPARAAEGLARVHDADRCGPWVPELLARYFVARGLTDADAGWGFARARQVAPALVAAESWPADRRAAFEAAAPQPSVQLSLPQSGFTVDGTPAIGALAVSPGWHRVQGPGFDGAVVLEADGQLVVPAEVSESAFQALDDEAARRLPSALLAARFGEGARVYVANDRGVWAAAAGRTDWLAMERLRRHPLVWTGLATTVVGLAATGAGGAILGPARASAIDANQRIEGATTPTAWHEADADYTEAARRGPLGAGLFYGGAGVTVFGGVLFGVGVALGPQTVGGG